MDARLLQPDEPVLGLPVTVGDFWRWAYSDILCNRNRSIFAEFIVASALGVADTPRVEWDEADMIYRGKKIEVKSSAFVQSWEQRTLSRLVFDISKRIWNNGTDQSNTSKRRVADCYIFCMYLETESVKANVLNLSKWHFHIATTEKINEVFGDQKSIGHSSLLSISPSFVTIGALKEHIDAVLFPS